MNDRQLHSFIAAAQAKSMSKAADTHHISTAALSQQISLLERDLGFSLLERSPRGVNLTPAGESFLPAAQSIVSVYERARSRGRAIVEGNRQLIIAHPADELPSPLARAMQRFQQEHPDVRIAYVRLPLEEQIAAIGRGEADLGLIAEPDERICDGAWFEPLMDETLSFCMRPNHPLSRKRVLRAGDLDGVEVICGRYPFLTCPLSARIPATARVIELDGPYDTAAHMQAQTSDALLAIHTSWSAQHQGGLKVVRSNISAGRIGSITRGKPEGDAATVVGLLRHTLAMA